MLPLLTTMSVPVTVDCGASGCLRARCKYLRGVKPIATRQKMTGIQPPSRCAHCWFVGLGVDDAVWDHSVFSKNRDRLLEAGVAAKFLSAVLANPHVKPLLSDEHFSVMLEACLRHDGTLIEAWASMKSFRARDGGDEPPTAGRNGEHNFHDEKRSNDTHTSPRPRGAGRDERG